MEGIGKPSLGGGKFTPPTPVDPAKVVTPGLPLPALYAVFVLFIIGGVLSGDDSTAHGFRMPGM